MTLSINSDRLTASLDALGRIGAYQDKHTGFTGVRRLAFSKDDGEARRFLVAAMKAAGLGVSVDRIGNLFGRRAGSEDGLAPVMMGSHIDSVATAGRFDGCLGVLGALEVVRTLNDAGRTTRRPLVMAAFSEEEGARFGTDMLGSAVATGRVPLEVAYELHDREGKSLRKELEAIGFLGEASEKLSPPHAYVECHIEQGPMLRSAGMELGVVTGVQAICWHALTITGKSAHAGTTPMHLRIDPGVAASRIQLFLRELVRSGRFGTELRATMGVTNFHPGQVNVVPNRVGCTVDIRHPEEKMLKAAIKELLAFYKRVAEEEKVKVVHRVTARTPPVPFSPKIQALVDKAATGRGLVHQHIVSGAGHDCQEMARLCPAGMIFVPGEHDGISHNPREFSTPKQCADGVNVLLDVVLELAEEPRA